MAFVYEPIDVVKYCLFDEVKKNKVDSFRVTEEVGEGDIVVFYLTNKYGFVGFGKVVSEPYIKIDEHDWNNGQLVANVEFLKFDFDNPVKLSPVQWSELFPGESARSAHIFNPPQDVIDFYERLCCHE